MKKVAVLGAGIMGAGIAQVAAQGGYSVILRDLQMSLVKDGLQTIDNNLDQAIKEGVFNRDRKQDTIGRIRGTTDLAELRDVDLVIEAVIENIAVKKQIFAELDNICLPHTILATNTSSLSITEIASATKRPDKVMGMHFFNPVAVMKLVELIKGMETSDEVINIAREFIARIDKECVVMKKERPGFIVNRILATYINEAIFALGEGIADARDIDMAMKLGAGMPRGPLELADMIGLDTLYAMILVFYEQYRDPKYRPHPLFTNMVRAGYYGKKNGKGFYNYEDNE